MKKVLRRFRSLPIRSRLAMLVAAAVAFGVAAVSVTCWFIVRGKLYDEINNTLKAQRQAVPYPAFQDALTNCGQDATASTFRRQIDSYTQVVQADGTVCPFPYATGTVKVTDGDTNMAKDPKLRDFTIRNGTDNKGNDVQVLTMPLIVNGSPNTDGPSLYRNAALVVAVPLKGTESTLNDLALVLLLVSGIGVVGAGAHAAWRSPARACARSTSSPRRSNTWRARRTSPSASRSRRTARTRSPVSPAPSTR